MYQVPQEHGGVAMLGHQDKFGIFVKVFGGILGGFVLGSVGFMVLLITGPLFSNTVLRIMVNAIMYGVAIGGANAWVQGRITRSVPQDRRWLWYAVATAGAGIAAIVCMWLQLPNRFAIWLIFLSIMLIGGVCGGLITFAQQRIAKIDGSDAYHWAVASVLGWAVGYGLIGGFLAVLFKWMREEFIL